MQIKLTDSGLAMLNLIGKDDIVDVSNARAYHLMVQGHANKDKSFMSLFKSNNEKPELKPKKPEPRKVERAILKPKTEKAVRPTGG